MKESFSQPIELNHLEGLAVLPDGLKPVYIHIDSGKITSIEETEESSTTDQIIFPGFIDVHVHAREYWLSNEKDDRAKEVWKSLTAKESFATAGESAINGGVTCFVAMPNDPDPPDCEFMYARKREVAQTSLCPVVLAAAVTSRSEPWEDLLYKVYLDPKPSIVSFYRWKDLNTAVARYGRCRVMFHAEDPEFIAEQGSAGPRYKTRPPEAEYRAVDRILELTAKFALRTHLCHISTRKAVELVLSYNQHSSLKVTTEATPHHLFFSHFPDGIQGAMGTMQVPEYLLECNPPIRAEDDRLFLLESLKDGSVDCLATDHAPHTIEDKTKGSPGMPHLDTFGPFVTWLIRDCDFSLARIAEVASAFPATLLGLASRNELGTIKIGYSASFTVLELNAQSRVEGSQILGRGPLRTRCGWSPFSGYVFPGQVTKTIISGNCYQFKHNQS